MTMTDFPSQTVGDLTLTAISDGYLHASFGLLEYRC